MEKPNKRILIVDDDPDLQLLLSKRLQSNGFRCETVGSVEGALQSLQKTRPDLVILDLGFENTDGTAFLKCARQWIPSGDEVPPVIVLSCFSNKDLMDYTIDLGARCFLPKPYDPYALLSAVNQCIQ